MKTAGISATTNAMARLTVSGPNGSDFPRATVSASNRLNRNNTSAPLRAVSMHTLPNRRSRFVQRSIQRDTRNDPTANPSRKPATINANAWEVDRP